MRNRVVNHFGHAVVAHGAFVEILADSVKHYHRFVHRIAQHRQHPSQHGERKLPLEKGKAAENNHNIVHIGDDGRHGKPPFKAHCQIDDDAENHHAQRGQTVAHQFVAHRRADELHLAQAHIAAVFFQHVHHLVGQLRGRQIFAVGQANHNMFVGAECLHLDFAHFQRVQAVAHLVQIRALCRSVFHFHQRAARKFHRQIQPARQQKDNGEDKRCQ